MRAEPKTVTAGPTLDMVSKESTNSAMMRKMRQGSSLIKTGSMWLLMEGAWLAAAGFPSQKPLVQGCFKVGRGMRKSETRMSKSERNPKSEDRIPKGEAQYNAAGAGLPPHPGVLPISGFGVLSA